MCGILAVASGTGPISRDAVARGLSAIAHRGPEGQDIAIRTTVAGTAAMAHCRLSIFDLSDAGKQPMSDARARSIIFNGSIFNWPELRQELVAAGYDFFTETDTEVILAAYDKWGTDCVTRFNGFWSFVLLDEGGAEPFLFFSRDRFGIKPLYFGLAGKQTILSSEIAGILAYLDERPNVDLPELARQIVFQLGDDSERTLYRNIYEVEPATSGTLGLRDGKMRRWRYWALCDRPFEGNDDDVLNRFTELFEDSVRIRLRADREVALTLSGGIDSSAIAIAISRASKVKVRAFTSHFPGRHDIDETYYAEIVAKRFGLSHVLVQPDLENLAENERQLTKHQELMYGSFSLLVNWYVIKEIQKHGVRIFLTGQGGDELFLGYERYYTPYLRGLLRRTPTLFARELLKAGRHSRLGVAGVLKFLIYFSSGYVRAKRYRRDSAQVYSAEILAAARGAPSSLPANLFELHAREICGQQLRHLLRYDDRTSAAFGTEGRPAFLDYRLVEFAASLGWQHKIRDGWTKYIIRRYLDRAGLPEIAWRRHKFGYAAPTLDWTTRLSAQGHFSKSAGARYLRPDLDFPSMPDRMRFPVYNLLSTSSEMNWR